MQKNDNKLLLTGGHAATPALGTVEEIVKREKHWKLYWIGPTSAMETEKTTTAAEKTLHEYGVVVRKIIAGKALRKGSFFAKIKAYIKIPIGFIHAFFEVVKINPKVVISFGGFAALPVVFSAWILGKKILIHEQITGAGLANKLSSPFATRIAVARNESLKYFPKSKTIVTGNPQVSQFFSVKPKETIGQPSTIFVTGGSSGSQIINTTILEILEVLLKDNFVVHQTGENNENGLLEAKQKLPKDLQSNYEVFGYTNPNKMANYFNKSDIIVSRAGANTVADIVAARRPAILIPISWSIGDEQRKNAQRAEKTGLVTILEQDDLSSERLLLEINRIKTNWEKIVKTSNEGDYGIDKQAAAKIVDILEELGE